MLETEYSIIKIIESRIKKITHKSIRSTSYWIVWSNVNVKVRIIYGMDQ